MKKKNKIPNCIVGMSLLVVLIAGCAAPAATTPAPTLENLPTAIPAEPTVAPAEVTPTEATPVQPEPTITTGQSDIDGRWEGSLTVAGSSLETIVYFRTEDGTLKASLDIPPQNLFGYSLANVEYDGSRVYFEGLEETGRKAIWDGSLTEDGRISGTFSQAGYTGTFELTPAKLVETSEEPLPYKEVEVTVQNGDITLGGTLTIPEGEGPFPAIVLISGSGAQNRDEEIYGFKLFGVIADQLTRNGIAVLRYDDRGVGASTGDLVNATSSDFATDVLAWVDYLKIRQDINPKIIGLLGHSEGGMIAPMVAAQSDDIAFVVLMAGTAMTGEEIVYKQVEMISRASGATEAEIETSLKMQQRVFDGLIRGQDWEGAKAAIHQQIADQVNALPETQKQALGNLDQYIETAYQQQIDALESAWYRYFLEYDPVPVLEQTTVPVLALFGGLDMQVPADPNAELMEAALRKAGNMDVTIITYPKANHLFQEAETGSPEEYATLKQEFIPGFLDDLTRWIKVEAVLAQ
ncbi:MAG: alpha/beta hydrolase [Chloroflexi bacterium]|nr:alpha/beta hydrolase [Chloroflexota bacterium]